MKPGYRGMSAQIVLLVFFNAIAAAFLFGSLWCLGSVAVSAVKVTQRGCGGNAYLIERVLGLSGNLFCMRGEN
jgi:hypothetical protein